MCSKSGLLIALAVCAVLLASVAAQGLCADKPATKAKAAAKKPAEPWDAAKAAKEYRSLGLELALARTGDPYLVIDAGSGDIALKVKGAVVWNSHLEPVSGDSDDFSDFAHRFSGGSRRPLRMMSSKYLFASKEKTPDSILVIVGKVVKADPQLLQRDIPERFELRWGSDLILDVHTDVVGIPKSRFKNAEVSFIEAIRRPFGLYRLNVRLGSDDALTLYRAAGPGLPTLVMLPD